MKITQLLLGILIAVSGTVEVQRNNAWVPIAAGAQINEGERVRTGAGSSATIELGPGAAVTLSQSSEMQVLEVKDASVRTFTADGIRPHSQVAPPSSTLYLAPYVCGNTPAQPTSPKR